MRHKKFGLKKLSYDKCQGLVVKRLFMPCRNHEYVLFISCFHQQDIFPSRNNISSNPMMFGTLF